MTKPKLRFEKKYSQKAQGSRPSTPPIMPKLPLAQNQSVVISFSRLSHSCAMAKAIKAKYGALMKRKR